MCIVASVSLSTLNGMISDDSSIFKFLLLVLRLYYSCIDWIDLRLAEAMGEGMEFLDLEVFV